ncbi:MAG: glycerol-3-phosphate cytidylyltransferase, partial [Clostridia bacterium]|nr:glycerol-3-phosphate cytidylyltransferase [Clostridia bacterium]
SPIALSKTECEKLFALADKNGCILSEAIKTAYSDSYYRLLLLAKIGKIGKIVSIDSTCTNLLDAGKLNSLDGERNSIYDWGPTAMLPVFQLLGGDYLSKEIVVGYLDKKKSFDAFTNIRFIYKGAVANVKVGKGIKSEGELIISGTEGYIYVPAPWWKTDYFEIRYENPVNNKRFFYQLDGEGIRNELISFVRSIKSNNHISYISKRTSLAIIEVIESFEKGKDIKTIDINNT